MNFKKMVAISKNIAKMRGLKEKKQKSVVYVKKNISLLMLIVE